MRDLSEESTNVSTDNAVQRNLFPDQSVRYIRQYGEQKFDASDYANGLMSDRGHRFGHSKYLDQVSQSQNMQNYNHQYTHNNRPKASEVQVQHFQNKERNSFFEFFKVYGTHYIKEEQTQLQRKHSQNSMDCSRRGRLGRSSSTDPISATYYR